MPHHRNCKVHFAVGILLVSLCAATTNITIGGLFSLFDANNNPDKFQLEHLSAFMLAIHEINANPNLLPSYTLNYVIDGGTGIEKVANAATRITESNIPIAISALPNRETEVVTQILAENSVMAVNTMARDTAFANKDLYPYHAQTIPIHSFEGMVLQKVLCELNLTRIAIFRSDDLFGSRYSLELMDETYCTIENLGTRIVFAWETVFEEELKFADETEATVFVILLSSAGQTLNLISHGKDNGLFHTGSQIFTHSVLAEMDTSAVDPSLLAGVMSVMYFPGYGLRVTEIGQNYSSNWNSQVSFPDCASTVDESGYHFLRLGGTGACAELNFTEYRSGAETLNPYSAHTYDAVYVAAHTLHYLASNAVPMTLENIRTAMFDNVEFDGATGYIDVFEGMSDFGFYGYGSREQGMHFEVMNYNPALKNFASVFLVNVDDGIVPCLAGMTCYDLVLNTEDNSWPSGYPPYAFDTAPTVVKLGGIFSALTSGGAHKEQSELLAAFLLAVDEINNKTDGIADDLLPNTKLVIAVDNGAETIAEAGEAIQYMMSSFYNSGVLLAINALSSTAIESTNGVAIESELFQIYTMARETALGDGLVYNYKAQTVPIHSFFGMSLQKALCSWGVSKIATISATSEFGEKAMLELFDETYCPLKPLERDRFLPAGKSDFKQNIQRLKNSGARIIVIAASAEHTAMILEQGREYGLFKEGVQVITSENYDVIPNFSPDADVDAIMKGVISLDFWADYSVMFDPLGQAFKSRFLSQDNAAAWCTSFARDSSGGKYLHRNLLRSGCAELDFAAYRAGNLSTSPFVAHTYDATYLAAHTLDYMIRNSVPITLENVKNTMFDHIEFEGASGYVDVFEGMSDFAQYGQGDRETGMHFRILNFNTMHYQADPTSAFATIGVLSVEDGPLPCPEGATCSAPIYDNHPNTLPKDRYPTVILQLTMGNRIFLIVLGALVALVVLAITVFLIKRRNHKEMKNAQVVCLYVILFGGFLAAARAILGAFELTGALCTAQVWVGHLAFFCCMFPLFMRLWRVNKILNNKGITRAKVSNGDVAKMISGALAVLVLYLIALTVVGRPKVDFSSVTEKNEKTKDPYCAATFPEFEAVLYAAEALLVLVMIVYCHAVKDIPEKYSDFKNTAVSMVIVVLLIVVAMPIVYLVDISYQVKQPLGSAVIAVGALLLIASLTTPKIKAMSGRVRINARQVSGDHSVTVTSSVARKKDDVDANMTIDQKFQLYTEKIAFYSQLRMLLEEERMSEQSSRQSRENCSQNVSDMQGSVRMFSEPGAGQIVLKNADNIGSVRLHDAGMQEFDALEV